MFPVILSKKMVNDELGKTRGMIQTFLNPESTAGVIYNCRNGESFIGLTSQPI